MGRIIFGTRSKIVPSATHTVWVETQIASGTLPAADVIDGVLGRDVLAHFQLIYDGLTELVRMRYTARHRE